MSEENKDLEGSNEDQNKENDNNWEDDDNFGLPDVEFTPIDRSKEVEEDSGTEEEFTFAQPDSNYESDESDPEDFELEYPGDQENFEDHHRITEVKEKKSSGGIIITIIVLIVLIGGVLGYIYYLKPMMDDEKYQELITDGDSKMSSSLWDEAIVVYQQALDLKPSETYPEEQIDKANAAKEAAAKKKAEDEAAAKKAAEEARLKAEAEAAAKNPEPGTVQTLSERTGRFYVVVASNIDGDLAMDFAKRLSMSGNSPIVIPSNKKGGYTRVCLGGDFDSASSAQAHADEIKGQYNNAWIVKF